MAAPTEPFITIRMTEYDYQGDCPNCGPDATFIPQLIKKVRKKPSKLERAWYIEVTHATCTRCGYELYVDKCHCTPPFFPHGGRKLARVKKKEWDGRQYVERKHWLCPECGRIVTRKHPLPLPRSISKQFNNYDTNTPVEDEVLNARPLTPEERAERTRRIKKARKPPKVPPDQPRLWQY